MKRFNPSDFLAGNEDGPDKGRLTSGALKAYAGALDQLSKILSDTWLIGYDETLRPYISDNGGIPPELTPRTRLVNMIKADEMLLPLLQKADSGQPSEVFSRKAFLKVNAQMIGEIEDLQNAIDKRSDAIVRQNRGGISGEAIEDLVKLGESKLDLSIPKGILWDVYNQVVARDKLVFQPQTEREK